MPRSSSYKLPGKMGTVPSESASAWTVPILRTRAHLETFRLPTTLVVTLLVYLATCPASPQGSIPDQLEVHIAPAHPRLLATPEEITQLHARVARDPWAAEVATAIIEEAEELTAALLDIPHAEGQWSHWYVGEGGNRLVPRSPTEHVDPATGTIYTGDPYDAVYVAMRHGYWLRGVQKLGMAYALTDDARYAERARNILLEYASFYRDLSLHTKGGNSLFSGARLFAQTLDEAVLACYLVSGYDLVYDAPCFTATDHDEIERGLLRPLVEVIHANDKDTSNWQTWHNAAVGCIGFVLGDRRLVDVAINGRHGLLYQLRRSTYGSGLWYELAPIYHWYALNACTYLFEAADRNGMDLYAIPRVRAMFEAPLRLVLPDSTFAPMQDSDRLALHDDRWFMEVAYARYGDERFAAAAGPRPTGDDITYKSEDLPESRALGLEAAALTLFWGAEHWPARGTFAQESSNNPSEGLAALHANPRATGSLPHRHGEEGQPVEAHNQDEISHTADLTWPPATQRSDNPNSLGGTGSNQHRHGEEGQPVETHNQDEISQTADLTWPPAPEQSESLNGGATPIPGGTGSLPASVFNPTSSNLTVLFDYGPGLAGHVQPAKLGIVLFADGDIRLVDPGRAAYAHPLQKAWYRRTIAHNTVVVDESDQQPAKGRLRAYAARDNWSLVRAYTTDAYQGVTLDRTLLLIGDTLVDVFQGWSDKEHTYDYPLHLRGRLNGLPPMGAPSPVSDAPGYRELWDTAPFTEPLSTCSLIMDKSTLIITALDSSESWYSLGHGPIAREEDVPMLLRRQHGKSASFITVFTPRGLSQASPRARGLSPTPPSREPQPCSAARGLSQASPRARGLSPTPPSREPQPCSAARGLSQASPRARGLSPSRGTPLTITSNGWTLTLTERDTRLTTHGQSWRINQAGAFADATPSEARKTDSRNTR